MEQPNVMPNGMGGGNNMNMPNASMQRAQNGNPQQQLHAVIMEHLRASLQQLPPGWQQTFDIRERANRIMQMVTMLRNLDNSMQKCLSIAENWEFKIITQCQSKEHYFAQWDQKFAEITRKRQMQASQNGLGMPQQNQNNMGNMHNMGMQQNGGMNGMNGMGGMNMNNFNGMGMNMPNGGMGMPNQMNMGQQGGFPQQLQRQMQPSPMPPQNQQQPQNGSIDPSALTRNPQMQNHMPNQMSQPNQQQQQQRQQPNMNPGQGGGPPNGPSDNEVKQLARRMHDSTSEEQKNQIRAQFLSNMTEQQRQQARQQNLDPLARFFMQRARTNLLKARQQGGQNGGMGMAMGASMQQNPSQSGQQQPNFDFSSMMGQQANAIKSQESGGEVVPASNNNNNSNNGGSNNGNSNNMMQQGGNNQQQMMNFGQNGAANPQMANNMQFAAMQEKQKREQMARQNHMAKQQAIAQQNQLRGQPGGLNAPNALNGGQVNSPAMNMNMLNRPTFPPGQTTPSTPHQNQNMHSQPPQTPSTGANQLQQHHQNMLNQNQMGHDNNLQQQFLNGLNPESRAKLANLNPEQVNQLMQKFAAQRQSAMAPPGGPPNGQNMGMNMGGQPMHNQAMMGNAVPGFNSQPPPNQQGHMEPQAGLHQKLQQQQNAQLKQKAMDSRPFPKQVLQTLSLSVPEHVNSWGKLRQHIVQNQSVLPQELMGKLSAMQNQWFDTHPEELKAAIEHIKRMIHAQNVQRQGQQGGPQGMPMPNGQAPQAQMVAPPAQMQQRPPSQAPDNIPQEHINKIREKWPQARNMTDDQIREQMRKTRANQMQQQANADMQQQQNLKNAQISANMQRAQQMMGNGGQQNQQGPQRQPGQQTQGQGQKRGNSDDVVEIPNPNAQAAQQQQPQQLQQSQQQNQQQRNMPPMPSVAGLKSREEIMAMPAEQREAYKRKMQEIQALRNAQIGIGANQSKAPQQQQMPQQGQQQQQPAPQVQQQQQPPPPPPQQNGAQNQAPANVQQEMNKIRGIYAKVQSELTKGPEVQLNQLHMQKAQELLRKLWPIAQTLDKTLLAGHRAFGEDKIREAIKIKHIILQNAADANGTIKDYLGVSLETLVYFERFIGEYLKELKLRQQAQNQPQAHGGQAQANAQPAAQQPKPAQQQPRGKQATPVTQQQKGQAQPPLNRKNSSQHARKASQNKAPPAPTDDTKKFDWSGTPTPHGVPKYDPGRTELTADKLKFPPPKKRKTTDSQSSTPAAQTGTPASPQVTSGPKRESPEQVRKMPPAPMPEPEKPRFCCEEPFCFASAATQGFDSEEALRKHMDEEHKTIEDPFKFLVETVDQGLTAMGVDKDGVKLPQQKSKAQNAARRAPAAQKVADRKAAAAATANATPALKAESATPATPASAGRGRAGVAATPVGKKAGETEAKEQAHEGDKTLFESIAEQLGIEPSANQPTIAAPTTAGAAAGVAEEDPFLFSLSDALGPNPTATNNFSSAMDLDEPFDFDAWCTNDLRDLDFGVPRESLALTASDSDTSPQLTPSSSITSQSTGEITIGEAQRLKMVFEWDPSGNGDTAVPERMRQMALSDGGAAGEGDKWNWSVDGAAWDEIFGLDVDGDHGFAAAFGGGT